MTHPANEQPKLDLEATDLRAALHTALCEYRLSNMGCEDEAGAPYPLIDLCSNDGTDISTGREELFNLADFLASDPAVLALIAGVQEGEEKVESAKARLAQPFTGEMTDARRAAIAADIVTVQSASPFSGISREVREALEFYATNWDWYPGDGEYNGIEPGSPPTYYEAEPNAALKDDGGEKARKALSTLTAGASNAEGGNKANIDEAVHYVVRFGGQCRDCGDHDGVCPFSGLPCETAAKTVRHVIDALRYGVRFGFIASPLPNAEGDAR